MMRGELLVAVVDGQGGGMGRGLVEAIKKKWPQLPVRAVGTIVHKGRSSHVWNVDVFTSTNKLVSSVRVVNSVMKKR